MKITDQFLPEAWPHTLRLVRRSLGAVGSSSTGGSRPQQVSLRKALLGLLAFCLLAVAGPASAANSVTITNRPPAPRRPNIIFILADDLGYGDLGCYGQAKIKTPNIDKLAAEGMRFTDFYAGSTVCAPSRCALMTGLNTGHARVRGNANVPLASGDLTVAELLQGSGYHTGLIGKWGLGNEGTTGLPEKKGFDEVLGYLDQTHAHDYYTTHLWRYDPVSQYEGEETFYENAGGKKVLYMPDLFSSAATNFIKINRPTALNHQRPFFLYLAYTTPHANNEEKSRTGNGMQVPSDAPYSDEPWPQPEKNKAAMITRMDAQIGALMARLQEWKIDENTLVFFSSDNGPHKEGGNDPKFFESGGGLRGIKRDLYEGGIRMPMIVRWPGHIKPGRTNSEPFAFWDFLPTAAQLAGTNAPAGLDGISFLPTLLGKMQTNHHDFLYWEFHEGGSKQAARTGDWKAVRLRPGAALELYNLKEDAAEKQDVAKDHPDVVARFEEYFKKARNESEQWPMKEPVATVKQ